MKRTRKLFDCSDCSIDEDVADFTLELIRKFFMDSLVCAGTSGGGGGIAGSSMSKSGV